jgi:hypothetical protein
MPRVEVIRGPEVNAPPMILVQERHDTETFAMTVSETQRWIDKNAGIEDHCTPRSNCLWCMVHDAVQGLA